MTDNNRSLKSKVLTALRWTTLVRIAAQLFSWTITIVVIRLLVPDDYGLNAMAEVIYAFLFIASSAGLGAALIQTKSLDDMKVRQIYGLLLVINILLFLIQYVLAAYAADYYNDERVTEVLRVLAFGFLLVPFVTIPNALLSRAMEFKQRAILEMLASVIGGIVTISLAYNGAGVWSLIYGYLSNYLINAIGLSFLVKWPKIPAFNFRSVSTLINFGGLVFLAEIVWIISVKLDVLIVGRVLGATVLGVYAVAVHISTLPVTKIMPLINQVALPAYSSIQDDSELVSYYFVKAVRVMSLFAWPIFMGIAAIADVFVTLVLGERWVDVSLPLLLLCMIMPLKSVSGLFGSVVEAIGAPRANLQNALMSLAIIPTVILVGVHWGMMGVIYAWLIGFPLVFILIMWNTLRIIKLSKYDFLKAFLLPSWMSIGMLAIVYLEKYYVFANEPTWIALISYIITGGVAYWCLMNLFAQQELKEVVSLFKGV